MGKLIYATNSGEITSSQLVYAGACLISKIKVLTDGSNNATIIVYDNTEGSGKVIDKTIVAAAIRYGGGNIIPPEKCDNGIYVTISGTGASVIISYILNTNIMNY